MKVEALLKIMMRAQFAGLLLLGKKQLFGGCEGYRAWSNPSEGSFSEDAFRFCASF